MGWPTLGQHGGSRESEAAVEGALRFFRRHQSPNGMWDANGYQDNCDAPGPKCEPGNHKYTTDPMTDIAMTAYAVLCYLGAGYDHITPNKYRTVVRSGLSWLKNVSHRAEAGIKFTPGSGPSNPHDHGIYADAIACMAIVEAYAMTQDRNLRSLAQGSVDYLLSQQIIDPRNNQPLGWNYAPKVERNDTSVTGWVVMALKSAAAGGLNVGQGMRGGLNMTRQAWEYVNKNHERIGVNDMSTFPYLYNPLAEADNANRGGNREFIGAVCAVFLGVKAGDPMLESMMNSIMAKAPQAYPCNTYSPSRPQNYH